MNDNFFGVIERSVSSIEEEIYNLNKRILDPQFHASRISHILQEEAMQIDTSKEARFVIEDLMVVLNKVPTAVADPFSEHIGQIENLKMQLAVWLSVKEKYAAHCHTEKAAKENEDRLRRAKEDREKKILEQVANGTIEESHGFARRAPGDHPGPSTREIRKAKAQLRDSSS